VRRVGQLRQARARRRSPRLLEIDLDRAFQAVGRELRELHAPAGRDSVSVVRYDAQELVRDVRNQWRDQTAGLPADGVNVVEETVEALAADLDDLLANATEPEPGTEPS